MDNRIKKLAGNIINYSISLKKGERVLINARGADNKIVCALIEEIYAKGGYPYVKLTDSIVSRALLMGVSEEQTKPFFENELAFMKQMDAYIAIRGESNLYEVSDVPEEKMKLNSRLYQPIQDERVKNTKWVILMSPSSGLAQAAKMSNEKYEDFYYKVCTLDYSKMSKAMDNLVKYMQKTDMVRLVAKNTDISFSIKGIPAIKCAGNMNIPDGEVFTAPVKNSVNGKISYNLDTNYNGLSFSNVTLIVENGKIINATSNNTSALNAILDTDEGSRYFGEFAIGVNPYITEPFLDILFDEKMQGSIHFTPGACYADEAPNGNSSAIHWDMVLSMLPKDGGGAIYFDNKLIRKDGRFVVPELECLNPENLI